LLPLLLCPSLLLLLLLPLQEDRIMAAYSHGVVLVKPEDVATGGVTSEMARKWKVLQDLQVRHLPTIRHITQQIVTSYAVAVGIRSSSSSMAVAATAACEQSNGSRRCALLLVVVPAQQGSRVQQGCIVSQQLPGTR
jgi:hypothetical protein